jgi:two-component system response regulator HydG
MPPLRDRPEDILPLADRFLAGFAEKNKRRMTGFTPRAADLLMRYDWPGNVRELENAVERAVILARGERIVPEDLPDAVRAADPEPAPEGGELNPASDAPPVGRSLKEMERQMILQTLEEVEGNRTRAAEILGISRRTLQNKLKVYGINE